MAFFKKTDHCTRCHAPLGERIAFMVREEVYWQIWGPPDNETGFFQTETVPVCKACLTVEEDTRPNWRQRTCSGCGRKMVVISCWRGHHWRGQYCSARCQARDRRKRDRIKNLVCTVCKARFRSSRKDARFCSDACRQLAYRQRLSVSLLAKVNTYAPNISSERCSNKHQIAQKAGMQRSVKLKVPSRNLKILLRRLPTSQRSSRTASRCKARSGRR